MTELSKITKLSPREIWPHEAYNFTKWLAKDENISLLSDELQMKFENVKSESAAGKYSVDIVADVAENGGKVIIENQLEKTDHKHLGQIMTYASTHDANLILWVVTECNKEHKQAVNWLNKNFTGRVDFFLIQVEVYKIGTSDPAPKFNIICEPDDWSETVKQHYSGNKMSEAQLLKLDYWKQIIPKANNSAPVLVFKNRPQPRHYYALENYTLGTDNNPAWIALTFRVKKNLIGCEVGIFGENQNKESFDSLYAKKDEIEKKLGNGVKIAWKRQNEKNFSFIQLHKDGDLRSKESWGELHQWHIETANAFAKVFQPYLSGD